MSWLIMTWALAQAGNRAGKTVRCPQQWESEPEWWAVTSGAGSPVQLPAFLHNYYDLGIIMHSLFLLFILAGLHTGVLTSGVT